jgi:hypothetical protein
MQHSTPRLKIEDTERFKALRELGCIACYVSWINAKMTDEKASRLTCGKVEVHHILSGNRRIGHDATIPLSRWHHQGLPLSGVTARQMEAIYGPSLARASKRFRETYGDEHQLLALTNKLVADAH